MARLSHRSAGAVSPWSSTVRLLDSVFWPKTPKPRYSDHTKGYAHPDKERSLPALKQACETSHLSTDNNQYAWRSKACCQPQKSVHDFFLEGWLCPIPPRIARSNRQSKIGRASCREGAELGA